MLVRPSFWRPFCRNVCDSVCRDTTVRRRKTHCVNDQFGIAQSKSIHGPLSCLPPNTGLYYKRYDVIRGIPLNCSCAKHFYENTIIKRDIRPDENTVVSFFFFRSTPFRYAGRDDLRRDLAFSIFK